jgi:acetylornithine deacetylase/succinyl-diaminopimelate desuccinylase-like protein
MVREHMRVQLSDCACKAFGPSVICDAGFPTSATLCLRQPADDKLPGHRYDAARRAKVPGPRPVSLALRTLPRGLQARIAGYGPTFETVLTARRAANGLIDQPGPLLTDTAMRILKILTLPALLCLCNMAFAAGHEALLRDLHKELVGINTAPSGGGSTEAAAKAMHSRLLAAGFEPGDIAVMGPTPELSALIARYRSSDPKAEPVLLMAHLDVVEALAKDWSFDPFSHLEQDGWFYGRGSHDNKAGAAILVSSFIRLKRENFKPRRDFIILLAADEETYAQGLQWLLSEHRELIDAEFALNSDSGNVIVTGGQVREFRVQTAEKIYVTYELEIRNAGGHSSKPRTDNAIYELARMLGEIEAHSFPIDLNETTLAGFRHYLAHATPGEKPLVEALIEQRLDAPVLRDLASFPALNALARTTCVATQLLGGHARNALPQSARAIVNCRVLPQSDAHSARDWLATVAAPYGATMRTLYEPVTSPPSPMHPGLFEVLEEVVNEHWPGIDLVPEMEVGATDGLFTRNAGIPTYGIGGLEIDPEDNRNHGKDERVGVQALYNAGDFWYSLLQRLGAASTASP